MDKDKIVFKGSHPDSLYRVSTDGDTGVGKLARAMRMLRWPVALLAVCVALAVFVYFLVPDNLESDLDTVNATYWEPVVADQRNPDKPGHKPPEKETSTRTNSHGMKTSEIDFYDAESDKNYDLPLIEPVTERDPARKLPIAPVFPTHIVPEVQYGNEKADADKLRTPKLLEETNTLPEDSTLKPHITQKPEKPLAIYFNDGKAATTTTSTETITRAETVNDFVNYDEKPLKIYEDRPFKSQPHLFKQPFPVYKENRVNIQQQYENLREPEIPPEIQEFYGRQPSNTDVNFTSGHSKLFGISIEDAEKLRSTTQSSLYNTRVSPTLPTWRDRDEATTKKYPVNVNADVPLCGSTRLALCRGVLPYDLAGTAVTVGGVSATALLSQIEYLVATNCSDRVRHFACALLEPECNPPPFPPKMPCYNLCREIIDNCEGLVPRELLPAFKCEQYSSNNCVGSKAPCYSRELTCGDGSCISRDWICDGTKDCPGGEDESACLLCEQNEFRCRTGGCILKQWLCDGYSDCAEGEDEEESVCEGRRIPVPDDRAEPGEESAGSAPAPAVRRPNRLPVSHQRADDARIGENDSSKELLITSDSSNALKRNFTRRPSLSRLTPYTRPIVAQTGYKTKTEDDRKTIMRKFPSYKEKISTTTKQTYVVKDDLKHSLEALDIGDLGFFENFDKDEKDELENRQITQKPVPKIKTSIGRAPPPAETGRDASEKPEPAATRLDKSMNNLNRVIDGAALLKKAAAEVQAEFNSPEVNNTTVEKDEPGLRGSISAHASPCPSGELRCVDGRCITLAQLCDGTIDCSDHADEDNCYT